MSGGQAAILWASMLAVACAEPRVDPPPRGTSVEPSRAAPAHPSPRAGVPWRREEERAHQELLRSHGWSPEPTLVTETVVEATPGDQGELRDYSAEVARAIGVPSECITPEIARGAGRELRIPVRVSVSHSGRVTRAEVEGSLPREARECVRRRAEAISVAPPIAGAPRTIAAELVIEVTPPPVAEAPPPPAWRLPPGAQPPAITLPAVGAEGRPPGTVPPDHTLPAIGAEGRPAGFVPPSHTLPAIGGP